jgi:hypothetical protein
MASRRKSGSPDGTGPDHVDDAFAFHDLVSHFFILGDIALDVVPQIAREETSCFYGCAGETDADQKSLSFAFSRKKS